MARTSQPPTDPSARFLSTDSLPGQRVAKWSVLWRGREILLHEGVATIGRAPNCTIMIDRPSVSRVHARLHVGNSCLQIEDLFSSNGVFVNGVRINGGEILRSGDRLLFGTEEFVVVSSDDSSDLEVGHVADEDPSGIRSIVVDEPGPSDWRQGTLRRQPGLHTTQKADAFQILGRLADRMLAMGRADAAVKILNGHMQELLAAARVGDFVSLEVVSASTSYALKIASFSLEPAWVNYVFELHLSLRSVVSVDAARQIQQLLNKPLAIDVALFASYLAMVRATYAAQPSACQHVLELRLSEP